jgi:hypothetical protein
VIRRAGVIYGGTGGLPGVFESARSGSEQEADNVGLVPVCSIKSRVVIRAPCIIQTS